MPRTERAPFSHPRTAGLSGPQTTQSRVPHASTRAMASWIHCPPPCNDASRIAVHADSWRSWLPPMASITGANSRSLPTRPAQRRSSSDGGPTQVSRPSRTGIGARQWVAAPPSHLARTARGKRPFLRVDVAGIQQPARVPCRVETRSSRTWRALTQHDRSSSPGFHGASARLESRKRPVTDRRPRGEDANPESGPAITRRNPLQAVSSRARARISARSTRTNTLTAGRGSSPIVHQLQGSETGQRSRHRRGRRGAASQCPAGGG